MPRFLPALLTPLVACAVLATGTSALASPSITPAAVPVTPVLLDPAAVASAQADVDALNADAAKATADLTAGTVQLEQGQARLAETQARAAAARAESDAAAARAAEAKALLGRVVNAAYRTPRPDNVSLALSALPGHLADVVLADAALDEVQGNQEQALQAATTQSSQAQQLADAAAALQSQAEAQARDLEVQVAALQAQAAEIRTRLDAAAARLAAAQALVAPPPVLGDVSAGGALCTGVSTAGYPNGFLPAAALCPLSAGVGQRLRADAANAFNRLAATHPICITDSYRSYGEQVDVYARKPGLAAVPGSSNHGLGLAVDLCGGIETFGTPEFVWMQTHAPAFGWVHPAWAEPGGSRPEPWHWEYVGVGSVSQSQPSQ